MNYDDVYQSALEAINETGRNVTLTKNNVSNFDPLTNSFTDGADTSRTVKAVFTNYKAQDVDGQIIRRGDKKCLIAGEVSRDEVLTDGTDQYNIVNIETVQPGDTIIMSKLQVRR